MEVLLRMSLTTKSWNPTYNAYCPSKLSARSQKARANSADEHTNNDKQPFIHITSNGTLSASVTDPNPFVNLITNTFLNGDSSSVIGTQNDKPNNSMNMNGHSDGHSHSHKRIRDRSRNRSQSRGTSPNAVLRCSRSSPACKSYQTNGNHEW